MYVFDLKDGVTLIDSAIHLASGMYFDVNVYLWAIDSSNNVKALDLNARKCILDTVSTYVNFFFLCSNTCSRIP